MVALGAGVHTGVAWMGAVGEGPHTALTAVGDAVNVTARLAALAHPGEILITATRFPPPVSAMDWSGGCSICAASSSRRRWWHFRSARCAQPSEPTLAAKSPSVTMAAIDVVEYSTRFGVKVRP